MEDGQRRNHARRIYPKSRGHGLETQFNISNLLGLSCAESEYYALTKGGCSGLGLQSLFADWNLKREGSCIANRSWQEHSSHTDEDVVATRTCSSETLPSCEGSNVRQ